MMTGVDMVHVPYRGGGARADRPARRAGAGHVRQHAVARSNTSGPASCAPLAVTTATRSEALPDIPTVGDFVPGYEASAWFGVGAPKNTPAEIIDKLNKEINAGLADPKIKARLADLGGTALAGSPADFGKLIAGRNRESGPRWSNSRARRPPHPLPYNLRSVHPLPWPGREGPVPRPGRPRPGAREAGARNGAPAAPQQESPGKPRGGPRRPPVRPFRPGRLGACLGAAAPGGWGDCRGCPRPARPRVGRGLRLWARSVSSSKTPPAPSPGFAGLSCLFPLGPVPAPVARALSVCARGRRRLCHRHDQAHHHRASGAARHRPGTSRSRASSRCARSASAPTASSCASTRIDAPRLAREPRARAHVGAQGDGAAGRRLRRVQGASVAAARAAAAGRLRLRARHVFPGHRRLGLRARRDPHGRRSAGRARPVAALRHRHRRHARGDRQAHPRHPWPATKARSPRR